MSTDSCDGQSYGVYKGSPFATGRKKLNLSALAWLFILPCIGFIVLNALMTFSSRLSSPYFTWLVFICFLFLVLYIGNAAWSAAPPDVGLCGVLFPCCGAPSAEGQGVNGKQNAAGSIFYVLIFWSLLAALLFAVLSGQVNFQMHTSKVYAINKFNTYMSVNATEVRGEQLMDAGRVMFAPGTKLDIGKSMAFKTKTAYCVVPIVSGNATSQSSYDVWAVGVNCCADDGSFACPDYDNAAAAGGRRLLSDAQHAYFRLAVQQAEAKYKIEAPHPVFFHWVQDPFAEVSAHHRAGVVNYGILCGAFCVFQLCIVAAALFYLVRQQQE